MQGLKISIITVSFNAAATIKRCMESVFAQRYGNIEYIVVDGCSTDGTAELIRTYGKYIDVCISGRDKGIYDAMNKGIKAATGDIIGTLNADDVFTGPGVLDAVAAAFKQSGAAIVYGNLNYINAQENIVRKWESGRYKNGGFNRGWMPPHPAFYCKASLFEQLGGYNLNYGTSADYELMLRFIHFHGQKTCYLPVIMVNMQTGGVSNMSFKNRVKAWSFDLKAMKNNHVRLPLLVIFLKPARKILQFFH